MKPDYQLMKKSSIHDLQETYNSYKKEYIKLIEYSYYNDDGIFSVLGYQDIVNTMNMYLEKINRIKDEINKLEEKMKEDKYDN